MKSGLFISSHSEELLIWLTHLLAVTDAESGIEFFVACLSHLSTSTSEYVDCILDAVGQTAAVKQSANETAEQVPSAEPVAIEG